MFNRLELMAGARNCVRGYSRVQPGHQVLLWTDRSSRVEEVVVDVLAAAVEETGATLTLLNDRPPIWRLGERMSPVAERAVQGADVVIHVFDLLNAASVDNNHLRQCLLDYDVRVTAVITPTADLLASEWARFPAELHWLLWRRSAEKVVEAPFRLTDPNGTDLRGTLKHLGPADAWLGKDPPSGLWMFFPGGEIAMHPESPLNGTVVLESWEGVAGLLKEPVVLTVEDHWITRVEGGEEARWLRRMFDRYPNGNYFCEIAWGLNPKPSLSQGLAEPAQDTILYRHAGVVHCGFSLWPFVGVSSDFHWDGGILRPTLTIGEECIIRDGHLFLLDDPEIWAAAAALGDPDDLLREVP